MSTTRPNVEVLRPGRLRSVLLLLFGLVAMSAGLLVVRTDASPAARGFGYAWTTFCGLVIVIAVCRCWPNANFLQLSPEGLTIRNMWRSTFHRWSDIERFAVVQAPEYRNPWRSSRRLELVGIAFSAAYSSGKRAGGGMRILGFDGALPDTYGWRADELAEHLNDVRRQCVGSEG